MKILQKQANRITKYLVFIVVGYFLFLCFMNYFAKKYGQDEGYILTNIKSLTITEMFSTQLRENQVFPRAYLALIKVFSEPFHYDLFALRFFPLLFMVAGFFIWFFIYKKEKSSDFQFFLLVFSLSSSIFTTYYASLLKQYSCDLFAVAIFTLFIYQQSKYLNGRESPDRDTNLWIFSFLSPFLIFFSQMSFLLVWVVFYNYVLILRRKINIVVPFLLYFFMAVVLSILVYFTDIRHSLRVSFMWDYWKECFIDTSSLYGFLKTFTNGLRNLIVRWYMENKLAESIATIFMPFCIVAIFKNMKESLIRARGAITSINSLCAVLVVELFILGVFKIYPFTGSRITLFIAPFIFFMTVKGIYLTKKIKPIFYFLLSLYVIFLCMISYWLFLFYQKLYL